MRPFETKQILRICRYVAFLTIAFLWNPLSGAAQSLPPVQLTPGTTTNIEIAETTDQCFPEQNISASDVQDFWPPVATCANDPLGEPALKMFAVSGFSTSRLYTEPGTFSGAQHLSSAAKLIRTIEIPEPTSELFSSTLRVQVATEVTWSGGFVAAGAPSTYAQVIATLRVRDVTDGDSGPVIAGDTFFSERFDAQFELTLDDIGLFDSIAAALNLVDAVDVSNSSGADVTAFLERGRTYQIELEARCDVSAPALGFGFCLFAREAVAATGLPPDNPLAQVFDDDGFRVRPFKVTVDSDPVVDFMDRI